MKLQKKKSGNNDRWLLTYSDLITLLMILFILLYAISNVNQSKYDRLADSLNKSLGNHSILDGGTGILDTDGYSGNDNDIQNQDASTAENATTASGKTEGKSENSGLQNAEMIQMQPILDQINQIIEQNELSQVIGTRITQKGLTITFSSNIFFGSGKADLQENMKEALNKISGELNSIDNSIMVMGYTDNVPIKDSIYTSNWQLSAIRAANVVQYLIDFDHVDYTRLMAVGCGENNPVDTNDTVEGRNKNRRIEINILFNQEQQLK